MVIMKWIMDEFKKLVEEASPGPWMWGDPFTDEIGCYIPYTDDSEGRGSWNSIIQTDSRVYPPEDNDAAFIIACRSFVPKLIAVAETANEAGHCCGRTECSCIDADDEALCRALMALNQSAAIIPAK